MVGVVGSSPIAPTNSEALKTRVYAGFAGFLFWSSDALGKFWGIFRTIDRSWPTVGFGLTLLMGAYCPGHSWSR
jgi:hypothetical protein